MQALSIESRPSEAVRTIGEHRGSPERGGREPGHSGAGAEVENRCAAQPVAAEAPAEQRGDGEAAAPDPRRGPEDHLGPAIRGTLATSWERTYF